MEWARGEANNLHSTLKVRQVLLHIVPGVFDVVTKLCLSSLSAMVIPQSISLLGTTLYFKEVFEINANCEDVSLPPAPVSATLSKVSYPTKALSFDLQNLTVGGS